MPKETEGKVTDEQLTRIEKARVGIEQSDAYKRPWPEPASAYELAKAAVLALDVGLREEGADRALSLTEAIIAELTHGGVNDEIAQVATVLGALAPIGVTEKDARRLGRRLDKARDDCRARLEAAISDPRFAPTQPPASSTTLEEGEQDWQYELHMEQCAHGGTLMRIDRLVGALREINGHIGSTPENATIRCIREVIERELERGDVDEAARIRSEHAASSSEEGPRCGGSGEIRNPGAPAFDSRCPCPGCPDCSPPPGTVGEEGDEYKGLQAPWPVRLAAVRDARDRFRRERDSRLTKEQCERRIREASEAVQGALREETDLLDSEGNPMEEFDLVAAVAINAVLAAFSEHQPPEGGDGS